ncbi:MAG: LysM peptidoglycan-binding domain-containing protein [Treponema sp.]|jgi:LysM repeat protein|nr:LysM peptidoglycan-binding domain-containing protein [Treponema sp.]
MDGFLHNQKLAKRQRVSFLVIDTNYKKSRFPFFSRRSKNPWQRWAASPGPSPRAGKIAVFSALGLIILGAFLLVFFALISPELPPENLVSALNETAGSSLPETSSVSQVVLPSEEKNWASLSSFGDWEGETGAGAQVVDRTRDIEYHIRPGETLSEIAYSYNIPYDLLAFYNNISNPNRIWVGMAILIPSQENMQKVEQRMVQQPLPRAVPARAAVKNVAITYENHNNGDNNGNGITVQFSVVNPPLETFQSFEWEFGDGKRGFRPNPSYEYTVPKTYVARLTARDAAGTIYKSNPLYIDIPHPASAAEGSTTKFITLSSPDEYFVVNGVITDVARYPAIEAAPLDQSESDQFLTKVRFTKPGFYGLTVRETNGPEQYYSVFVSPIPSMHADAVQQNFNWYRTQYNTGTTSNCGPASVSMAIGWSLGKYFPVASVREAVGWQGNGGTSFEELIRVIRAEGVPASIRPLRTVDHIKDVIDGGDIAIALFRTEGVKTSRTDPAQNLFGKYYNDTVGHYIVIKGYSLNGEYFVIHDPIPSDWGTNSFRYGDEVSMIGRNRYYSSAELLKSLRRTDMIVVSRGRTP